jgi:hypothetical protein
MSRRLAFENLASVDSVQFDGSTNYCTRGAGLSGASDSQTGIFSGWVRLDGGNATPITLIDGVTGVGGATSHFFVERDGANLFSVIGTNAAGTSILSFQSSSSFTSGASWHHLLCSWNLASGNVNQMYVDDASNISSFTFANDTLDYTLGDWGLGARPDATRKMNGCLAEIYFAPGQYLDFSVVANRRKFISAGKRPMSLGSDGSLPTGTAPLMYHKLVKGETVNDFATNRGSGGNFAVTGTLSTGSTSPGG